MPIKYRSFSKHKTDLKGSVSLLASRHPSDQLQVAVQSSLYTQYWLEFGIAYVSKVLNLAIHSADVAE